MKITPIKQIEKIVVNTGIGRLSSQPNFSDKVLPEISANFAAITGQKPSERSAKKSISSFKLREGTVVGLKATLRKKRMELFLDKVIRVVLPRVRDFQGISINNIDGHGNLNFGVKDQLVFPEINPETSKSNFGLEITVVPRKHKTKDEAIAFYKEIGIPFEKTITKK
ncbi:MAG: 50S ribosomal protein L5 [bacterium]|nr:50S ribosomal protein L5 [bacterium]